MIFIRYESFKGYLRSYPITAAIAFLCIVCLSLILKDIDRVGALLFLLSIPTLPVIVFSLIYQCCVIKIWCKVCLLIDLLLVGQICIFYTQFQSFDINFYSEIKS